MRAQPEAPRRPGASYSVSNPRNFGRAGRFVQGWFWVKPSSELRRGQVQHLRMLGRDLALYRTEAGEVHIVDAHCPHMGCHMAEGRVQGEDLQCFFHGWKFGPDGQCIEVPSLDKAVNAKLVQWPTAERYGMIWLWPGDDEPGPLPYEPELGDTADLDWYHGGRWRKACHPNVVMVNAADAHHFNTVHQLPAEIVFETQEIEQGRGLRFWNTTRGGDDSFFVRMIRPFYKDAITYNLCYWYGSTGFAVVGPDGWHFYIMFVTRPDDEGGTEGHTLCLAPRRPGALGWLQNRLGLRITRLVGAYFARGDTHVFETIKWGFQNPVAADRSIVDFVHNVDRQRALEWGSWGAIDDRPGLRALPV